MNASRRVRWTPPTPSPRQPPQPEPPRGALRIRRRLVETAGVGVFVGHALVRTNRREQETTPHLRSHTPPQRAAWCSPGRMPQVRPRKPRHLGGVYEWGDFDVPLGEVSASGWRACIEVSCAGCAVPCSIASVEEQRGPHRRRRATRRPVHLLRDRLGQRAAGLAWPGSRHERRPGSSTVDRPGELQRSSPDALQLGGVQVRTGMSVTSWRRHVECFRDVVACALLMNLPLSPQFGRFRRCWPCGHVSRRCPWTACSCVSTSSSCHRHGETVRREPRRYAGDRRRWPTPTPQRSARRTANARWYIRAASALARCRALRCGPGVEGTPR